MSILTMAADQRGHTGASADADADAEESLAVQAHRQGPVPVLVQLHRCLAAELCAADSPDTISPQLCDVDCHAPVAIPSI